MTVCDVVQSALAILLNSWARYQPEFCDGYDACVAYAAVFCRMLPYADVC